MIPVLQHKQQRLRMPVRESAQHQRHRRHEAQRRGSSSNSNTHEQQHREGYQHVLTSSSVSQQQRHVSRGDTESSTFSGVSEHTHAANDSTVATATSQTALENRGEEEEEQEEETAGLLETSRSVRSSHAGASSSSPRLGKGTGASSERGERAREKRGDSEIGRACRFARNFLCWVLVCLATTFAAVRLYMISTSGHLNSGDLSQYSDVDSSASRYPVALNPNDVLRRYRLFQLPNGLDVACVYDPQARSAAASMNVRVGSFQDPDDTLGLAHFTEHMLFLGESK